MKTELTQMLDPTTINELAKSKNAEIDRLLSDIETSKQKIADLTGGQKQMNMPKKFTDDELDAFDFPLEDCEIEEFSISQIIKKLERLRESTFNITAKCFLQGSKLYFIMEALNYVMSKMDRTEELETNRGEISITPFDELQDLMAFLKELRYDYDYFYQDTLDAIKRKIELMTHENAQHGEY